MGRKHKVVEWLIRCVRWGKFLSLSFKQYRAQYIDVSSSLFWNVSLWIRSAALNFAHVATGQLDMYQEIGCWRCVSHAYFENEQCCDTKLTLPCFSCVSSSWDVCAGVVIAREAGGKVRFKLSLQKLLEAFWQRDTDEYLTLSACLTIHIYCEWRSTAVMEASLMKKLLWAIISSLFGPLLEMIKNQEKKYRID